MHPIPLADLSPQHAELQAELDDAVRRVVRSSSFIGGEELAAFSREFAELCHAKRCVPCSSGTDALTLAILGLLGRGDERREIITTSFTFAATVEAIAMTGYRPVFVDIDPQTYTMDLAQVEAAITPRTAAIIPVHLYGQMLAIDELVAIANRHQLPVIEDAAQAHGATWEGIAPGQVSAAACFSFFPSKNLGAWGDAGAVVTQHDGYADRVASLADHGRVGKYEHHDLGLNARMDNLQAAVLRVKLRRLAKWNDARRRVAGWYGEQLADVPGVTLPEVRSGAVHVYHQYVVRVSERDAVAHQLAENRIGCGVHYPTPVHMQKAFDFLQAPEDALPETLSASREVLSLPMYPHMTIDQVQRVCECVSASRAAVCAR